MEINFLEFAAKAGLVAAVSPVNFIVCIDKSFCTN